MNAVHAAIAKRYPSPEFALFFEVRDNAGFNARRSADVVAMNTWPSRGLAVHGFEVKTARSDWLRELKDPEKSASVQRFCDRWWLVAGDEKVAKVDEVPEQWGLLVLKGKALTQVKEAPPLTSEPLTKGFVAMLLRNATSGMVAEVSIEELVQERVDKGLKMARDRRDNDLAHITKVFEEQRERIDAFEKASGVPITDRWGDARDPAKLGAAVKAVLSGVYTNTASSLDHIRGILDRQSKELGDAIAALTNEKEKP